DLFRTPYTAFGESLWPGVEIHATEFLNLLRDDWLRRLDPFVELGLTVFFGLLAGLGLAALRPRAATLSAVAAAGMLAITAWLLIWHMNTWFAWLIPVAVQ